jgi:hypothetical protein
VLTPVEGTPGPAGPTGATGATGATGSTGATGPGVAAGGTTGQVLTKTSSTDYATNWQTPAASPVGAVTSFSPVRRAGGAIDAVGTGGVSWGRYQVIGGICHFAIYWQFGTSGTVGNAGVTTFDAPVPFSSTVGLNYQPIGSGQCIQAGQRFNFQVTRDAGSYGFQLWAPAQATHTYPGGNITYNDFWQFNGWYWV